MCINFFDVRLLLRITSKVFGFSAMQEVQVLRTEHFESCFLNNYSYNYQAFKRVRLENEGIKERGTRKIK